MTRDEVRLELATKLSVPCPRCGGPCPHGERCGCFHSAIHACHTNPDYKRLPLVSECENCAGTGYLWPWRESCAYLPTEAWLKAIGHLPDEKRFALRRKAKHDARECGCEGRGWVLKDWHLEDLLAAAGRAKLLYLGLLVPVVETLAKGGSPTEALEAAEWALLQALPK